MRVLVTGATGFVGGHLLERLAATDHDVVALTRSPETYDPPAEVSVAGGDLLEAGSFEDALAGVDAAYYLVHSMDGSGDFAERDRRAARNFADAAGEAGLERVVYLGGLGADGEDLSEHLRSRREVERVLAAGDYELTTLRAAIIVGDGSASFELICQLDRRLPVMITPRWVSTPCQPIAIDDVVAYLVGVLDAPETAGETYEIGGPEVLTYAEILRRTARVMGRREPILLPVPVLSPQLSALWIGLVTDVSPTVARPLIHGLKNPVVADDESIREHVDVELTAFDEAVARALGDAADRGRTDAGTPVRDGAAGG